MGKNGETKVQNLVSWIFSRAAGPKSGAETFEKTPSTLKIKVIILKVNFRLFGEDMCEWFAFYGFYSQFKVLKLDEWTLNTGNLGETVV